MITTGLHKPINISAAQAMAIAKAAAGDTHSILSEHRCSADPRGIKLSLERWYGVGEFWVLRPADRNEQEFDVIVEYCPFCGKGLQPCPLTT